MDAKIRSRCVDKLGILANNAARAVRKWIENFRSIVTSIPPRVGSCLLKAGLHGWATDRRIKQRDSPCFLCNRYSDSLNHISRCAVTRRVWNMVLPLLAFDYQELLGFVHRTLDTRTRVSISCVLFLIYEARRAWQFHGRLNHNIEVTSMAVLSHAASLVPFKGPHVRQFVASCEAARAR